jgi:hypothetical protein
MNEQQEIRAKALEIAVLIRGSSPDSPLNRYLPLAGEIAGYITGPQDPKRSSVGEARLRGI